MNVATLDALEARVADEPAFGLDRSHELHLAKQGGARRIGDFLAHAIAREPQRLLSHVQRIVLWKEVGDAEETWGALVDLNVTLGAQGADLRRRMLVTAAHTIPDDARQFLALRIATGMAANAPHPPAPTSVLTQSITGMLDVAPASASPGRDVAYGAVAEARDLLIAGDIAGAMDRLERELDDDPRRADAAADLLAIYEHERDVRRLQEARARYGAALPDPAAWDDVERRLCAPAGR